MEYNTGCQFSKKKQSNPVTRFDEAFWIPPNDENGKPYCTIFETWKILYKCVVNISQDSQRIPPRGWGGAAIFKSAERHAVPVACALQYGTFIPTSYVDGIFWPFCIKTIYALWVMVDSLVMFMVGSHQEQNHDKDMDCPELKYIKSSHQDKQYWHKYRDPWSPEVLLICMSCCSTTMEKYLWCQLGIVRQGRRSRTLRHTSLSISERCWQHLLRVCIPRRSCHAARSK